jgi:flagellar basal body-associated protein FliL
MADEDIQESNSTGSTPPKKKKKSPLMMILVVVIAAGVAGGAGYYFYSKTMMGAQAQVKKATEESHNDRRDDRKDDRRGDDGGSARDEARGEIGPIVALEPFVMNVSGSASRFVKMGVALEVRDAKLSEEVKKMTPAIRDAMLGVLGTKAPEAFTDVAGRNEMKKELFDSVRGFFKKGDLQAVYITDVIMQ